VIDRLTFDVEKDLLIKGWMSHDARWFMEVAHQFGIPEASRLNQRVCRNIGRVEMKRFMQASRLPPPRDIHEFLSIHKSAVSLYGPDLIEFEVDILDQQSYKMYLTRCFAHENIVRAGIGDQYECGIFARIQGWIDALGLTHELYPPLGKCMKVLGKECFYTVTLRFD
jgi:hypothetical protein